MLDVHVIVSSTTPDAFVERCLGSVVDAIDRAPYPVNIHLVDGVPGHIGRARAKGFALGDHPYVSWVDDDDWLDGQAFVPFAVPMLDKRRAMRSMGRNVIHTALGGTAGASYTHAGLAVLHRDLVNGFDFESHPYCGAGGKPCSTCTILDAASPVHRISDVGYYRRIHASEGAKLRQNGGMRKCG